MIFRWSGEDDDHSERPQSESDDGEPKLGIFGKLIEDVLLNECSNYLIDNEDGVRDESARCIAYAVEKALAARGLLR